MRFTLTYEGPLASSGRPNVKHDIRRQLHPQLKKLWQHQPLKGHEKWIQYGDAEDDGFMLSTINGHDFVSIVHPYLKLYVELDILILRSEPPGSIVLPGGDIDNRLKTLFDALRAPGNAQEIPPEWTPSVDEQPLFCLLQDDRLISRVNVDTDRLLAPNPQPSHVKLIIRTLVKGFTATWGNLGIIA